jgi:hypothetical protein
MDLGGSLLSLGLEQDEGRRSVNSMMLAAISRGDKRSGNKQGKVA